MGTLLPGSHHEVLRSVRSRLRGSCPSRRRGCCRRSPCLWSPLWSSFLWCPPLCCPWVCSALRRSPRCLRSRPPLSTTPLILDLSTPFAEAYVHDAAGDVSDNSSPEAEAYVHDTTG